MDKKILAIIIFLLIFPYLMPTDSSDGGWYRRSGLIINVDELTGCHYIKEGFGGILPRLDKDGQHICTGYPK